MDTVVKVDRREFLNVSAGAGAALVLGFWLPGAASEQASAAAALSPNAFLSVDGKGIVTVWVAKCEMGQGVRTSLPMIVAEELDADWTKVRVEQAVADPKYGGMTTGGSTSVRNSWTPLRKAGAAARAMLISAAAERWNVESSSCRTEKGEVLHPPTGRRAGYGEIASAAALLKVPPEPLLKEPSTFKIVGKRIPRLDTPEKVDGSALFGSDLKIPGMLIAMHEACPVFGGRMKSCDASAAKAVTGVLKVIESEDGVTIVAESTWAALEGRRALKIEWEEGAFGQSSSASLWASFREWAGAPGAEAKREGDAAAALSGAAKRLKADYEAPFLAHATMEPMVAVAHAKGGSCEIWAPTQMPRKVQEEAAKLLGLPEEKVVVRIPLLGGGFGRRLWPDTALRAVAASKAVGAPVKLVGTREDDIRHDYYRPMSLHRLEGGLSADGSLLVLSHRVVTPSIMEQSWPGSVKGADQQAVSGAADQPYAIPNLLVEHAMANTAVPAGWWRSVYPSQNAFALECFLDELAEAAGKDPLALRLSLLKEAPRMAKVLEVAAEKSGWGRRSEAGRALGIACCFSYGSYVAQVAEAAMEGGRVRVKRVVCALDCGQVVNPDTVEAQVEGGIVYGLSAALTGEITIEQGRVKQGNFDDYEILRMAEAPAVEVHIVPSREPPGGIGEPGLPPAAPAAANALSRLLGRRLRRMPLSRA